MANTTSSRKAKGRRAQQRIVDYIKQFFNVTENDVKSIPASVPGPDIWLSQYVIDKMKMGNWDIEVKNQEKINIWQSLKQLNDRNLHKLGNYQFTSKPQVLMFTRNNCPVYAVIKMEDFFELIKKDS